MNETRFRGTGPSDRAERARRFLLSPLALCFIFLVAFPPPALCAEPGQPKNVLILYSFSKREALDPEPLQSAIRSHASVPVNFYVEYLETQQFGSRDYENGLSEILRDRYARRKPDLVIVVSYSALRFAAEFRDRMFPGVPIVFTSIAPARIQGHKLWPGVTGVTLPVDVRGTLNLALHLHPGTKNIAVIAGQSEFESYWLGATHQELQRHRDELKVIDLVGLSPDQLLKQVSTLPSQTVVFFQLIPQGSSYMVIDTYDVLAAIAQRFPVYCIHNYCLDHGALGGSYPDSSEQAAKAGELADRVLAGEKPEDISVIDGTHVQVQVDWRQLRRWNIPESALPPGTIVLYRQPAAWERYQKYIVAGTGIIVVQALLIFGLLWQRARKKAATADLRRLGGYLIHAQEEERARIARELHDDFSQRLAVQSIELTQLEKNLPASQVDERARALKLLRDTKEMSADIRALSHQLHSSRLGLVGLVPALRGLCEEVRKKYNIDIDFTEREFPGSLTKDVGLCLFRVAQEALVNVVRHSHARTAHVELGATANGVRLRVSDAGKGFDPELKRVGAGIGLIGMRERVRLVGGRLWVRSELNRGTEVLVDVPLSADANEVQVTTDAIGGMVS